ncbi:MAG: hypothetical protein KF724_00465 [Phycisphaeraceae bacterium]|nr:hypothetical protein [Phycisphaeraceae bacterium]
MSIVPLPIFERDADPSHRDSLTDAETYARLRPPTSIVVRYGRRLMVGEFPYDGDSKPGCGSKMVARTPRGVELVEMLTTTCGNSGCSKSVSRKEMLDYIANSGGREYPFAREGRVLRVATVDDLSRWSGIRARFEVHTREIRGRVLELGLPMKVIEVEPILGGETVTVHYASEERVDFRELVHELAGLFKARIEMVQTGARDEARLVADYERCGQHCCCKTFLKVLKPISMKSAKVQKATLDPLKISGRCGRLMCCLRYEDETYDALKKRLPRNKTRVGTSEGPGIVVDSKILVQLVLVRLEADGREIAVPVEELSEPPPPGAAAPATPPAPTPSAPRSRDGRGREPREREHQSREARGNNARGREPSARDAREAQPARDRGEGPPRGPTAPTAGDALEQGGEPDPFRGMDPAEVERLAADPAAREKKRRRRRRRKGRGSNAGDGGGASPPDGPAPPSNGGDVPGGSE